MGNQIERFTTDGVKLHHRESHWWVPADKSDREIERLEIVMQAKTDEIDAQERENVRLRAEVKRLKKENEGYEVSRKFLVQSLANTSNAAGQLRKSRDAWKEYAIAVVGIDVHGKFCKCRAFSLNDCPARFDED